MSKHFTRSHEFDASVDRIFDLLTTEESVVARYGAAGFGDVKVVSRSIEGSRLEIAVERTESGNLPGPLAKLTSGAVRLRQTDTWAAIKDKNERRATWKVSTRGVPVTISGEILIEATSSGATLTQSGEVAAKIPIMGGKIEAMSIEQTKAKLDDEWRWLAEHLEGDGGDEEPS
jgi:hypothetical protein